MSAEIVKAWPGLASHFASACEAHPPTAEGPAGAAALACGGGVGAGEQAAASVAIVEIRRGRFIRQNRKNRPQTDLKPARRINVIDIDLERQIQFLGANNFQR